MHIHCLFFLLFFLCSCRSGPEDQTSGESQSVPQVQSEQIQEGVKILVFGDSGTGDDMQIQVAEGMKKVCQKEGCGIGLLLGDNFYPAGVQSIKDSQFIEKFEKPYGDINIEFYPVLGNHDYAEDLGGFKSEKHYKTKGFGNVAAQINYSATSSHWRMPSEYYKFSHPNNLNFIEFFALDTSRLSNDQVEWFKKSLAASTAQWKVVFGHHPVRSYGLHGDTEEMIEKILPSMCEFGVNVYLSGHDHAQQIINETTCSIVHVVTGAAGKNDDSTLSAKISSGWRTFSSKLGGKPYLVGPNTVWSDAGYGFVRLVVDHKSAEIRVYNDKGTQIHRQFLKPLTKNAGN